MKPDAVTQESSRKLVPKKTELSRVHQVRRHTATADVNGTQNVVSTDRITLARVAKEAMRATEVEHHYDVS